MAAISKHLIWIIVLIVVIALALVINNNKIFLSEKINIEKANISERSELDVPEDEIISGGPGRDGIPPIDAPKFISPEKADFLNEKSPGLLVKVNNDIRFYPYNILNWHEIVNDEIGGKPLTITYCPLCATGIVFEREINGKILDFGTSGKLYQSNLVMYDRQTDSLWSQVLGGAIKGELKGTYLKIYPSSILEFGEAKKLYQEMKVLSTETGHKRSYTLNPYGNYENEEEIYFPVKNTDKRLSAKELIYGISIDGTFKAYHYNNLIEKGKLNDNVAGHELEIKINEDKEIIIFDKTTGKRAHGFVSFWFAWITHHPDANVWIE